MTKNLRKIHSRVWVVLATLLPIAIVLGWLVIPVQQPANLITTPKYDLLPLVYTSHQRQDYCIEIRTNSDTSKWQLHWINKRPLTVPTALIYQVRPALPVNDKPGTPRLSNAEIIARIEAKGHYQFPLTQMPVNGKLDLVIYDFIYDKIFDSITLRVSPVTKAL